MVAYSLLDWKHVTVSPTGKSPLHGHYAAAFSCDLYCRALASPADAAPIDSLTSPLSWGRAQTLTAAEIGLAAAKR